MARKPRIHFSGAMYHVMLRGNLGEIIFRSDLDRQYFLSLLTEGLTEYDHVIHAFCLMDNHVHFLIQVFDIRLGKIMHNLAFRYAQWVNKHENRKGHVFQGRYQSKIVEDDAYLMTLIRYIHLNPIRANMVKNIDDYLWCSHISYINKLNYSWLTKNKVLNLFSSHPKNAVNLYTIFLQDTSNQTPITPPKNFNTALTSLIHVVTRHFSVSIEHLYSPTKNPRLANVRAYICLLAKELHIESTSYISSIFHRDKTTLIHSMQRLMKSDEAKEKMKELRAILTKQENQLLGSDP